jgi:hypothetical protein
MAPATVAHHFALSSLAEEIGHHIPAVLKIYADQHGDFVSVWTVVEDFDRGVRNNVYEAEEHLMRDHPDTRFDFHVVKYEGQLDIFPSATTAYSRY